MSRRQTGRTRASTRRVPGPILAETRQRSRRETGSETGRETGRETGSETGKETGKETGSERPLALASASPAQATPTEQEGRRSATTDPQLVARESRSGSESGSRSGSGSGDGASEGGGLKATGTPSATSGGCPGQRRAGTGSGVGGPVSCHRKSGAKQIAHGAVCHRAEKSNAPADDDHLGLYRLYRLYRFYRGRGCYGQSHGAYHPGHGPCPDPCPGPICRGCPADC